MSVDDRHGAVELRGTLQGPGKADAAFLDLTIDAPDLTLWTMRGGRFRAAYPSGAFEPVARVIHPRIPLQPGWPADQEFGSENGRSSDGEMPFFLLEDPDGKHGIWIALGWSGHWRAHLRKLPWEPAHRLWVTGPGSSITLSDGESFAMPRVFVGTYSDGDGWTAIRRFLAAKRPRPSLPWVVYNTWFNVNAEVDEEICLRTIDVASEMGIEVFCIDAAWYGAGGSHDFQGAGIGTWDVDTSKFPRGIEFVSKYAHEARMLQGLWFDPERAHPDSRVAREHPEWLRKAPHEEIALVDFGIPAARNWALDVMSSAVAQMNLDWIKWDFNFHDLMPFWGGDERAEVGHVLGVYEVMDGLRARHPSLILEACAGGGNRIDIEMLARSDSYWVSDQTVNPDIIREHLGNLCRILPAQYRYTSVSPQGMWPMVGEARATGPVTTGDPYPDEMFLSSMGGTLGIMDRIADWPPELRRDAANRIARFKEIRHLLDGSFALFRDGDEKPLRGWEAWEFSDPDTGEAALIAFRLGSPRKTRAFRGRHRWQASLPPGGATVLHRDSQRRA